MKNGIPVRCFAIFPDLTKHKITIEVQKPGALSHFKTRKVTTGFFRSPKKMKLKIVHQNQEIRAGAGGEDQAVKKAAEGMEQVEEPRIRIPPESEPEREDSRVLEASLVSDPMVVSGKRKRKPKEVIDEVSPVLRRNKKKYTFPRSKEGSSYSGGILTSKGDAIVGGSSNLTQLKSPTLIRAEEVQRSLSNDHPSFLKVLVRSHVASCVWMGLPVPFCKIHLPSKDTQIVLENEIGEEFAIKYIAHKTGLSAGWRKFVAGNKLIEGDVLIFQLIEPLKVKVYVIRANDLTEVDGALSLLILDSQIKQHDVDSEGTIDLQSNKTPTKSLPLPVHVQKNTATDGSSLRPHIADEHSGNDSEEVASEVLEGTKSNRYSLQFKDVKGFDDFHVTLNGACLDHELPEHIRRIYYDLCCSQNAYLHDRVLPGLYSKLAAGVIVETVNITEFIKACKPTTSRTDFEVRDKSLRSFELLGLNVGFLRARLLRLLGLAHDSEGGMDVKMYIEARNGKSETQDKIWKLESKLVELKELHGKYVVDVENLQAKVERYAARFQEEVNAPW